MKLILAVVHNDDVPIVTSELNKAGFQSTKIASTGGFLSAGNTTFITGVEDEKLDEAIKIIKENGKKRTQLMPVNGAFAPGIMTAAGAIMEVQTGGATIFVIAVENFIHV